MELDDSKAESVEETSDHEIEEEEEEERGEEEEEMAEENYEDEEKNLDEILDELKEEDKMGSEEEEGDQDDEHEHANGNEGEGKNESDKAASAEEKEAQRIKKEKEEEDKLAAMDPSKGFLENEQDKMIAGSWKYRLKIQSFNFEARELNHDNIEKLVNISLSSALYFSSKGTGKKLGKMEIFCSSQTTGELAIEKVLRLDVNRPISLYIMRKANMEDKELAFLKLDPSLAHQMHFRPLRKHQPAGGKPSTRSVYVNNIPEGTSDELLQALFPCSINIVKPEENEGKNTGSAVLECLDKGTAISVLKSYLRVQIGSNPLDLSLCSDSKTASAAIDAAKAKEEAKEEEKKKEEDGEKDGEKSDKEEDKEKKGSDDRDRIKKRPTYGTYRSSRGNTRGSSYVRGSRYRPSDRFNDQSSYQNRETQALRSQIAMLQQNISLLTQNMTPMMMAANTINKRPRTDTGHFSRRDDFSSSNRGGSSRGGSSRYGSRNYGGGSYGGGGSWSESQQRSGGYEGSRKRSYNWDDDYSSGRDYKKFY